MPTLEKLSKEGASGQRKINQYTRLATIPICVVQSFFVIFGGLTSKVGSEQMLMANVAGLPIWYVLTVMVSLTAGTMFIMWIGEQITENGVGNGISIIIMAGIIAQLWPTIVRMVTTSGTNDAESAKAVQTLLLFIATWGVAVVAVVFMTKAHRRITIRQAKQTRGKSVYGGQKHYLPIKVNSAGVMPIIFASALLLIPSLVGNATGIEWLNNNFGNQSGFWHIFLFAGMIFFFSFFWTSLMFQPNDMANNLKENGSFIPGIRPGKQTAEFLENTMVRVTLAGAAFLALIAVFPAFIQGRYDQNLIYFMSGTSILIVVSVALDLVEKLNAMLIMKNYEGFMKEAPQGAGGADSTSTGAAVSGAGWGRRSK